MQKAPTSCFSQNIGAWGTYICYKTCENRKVQPFSVTKNNRAISYGVVNIALGTGPTPVALDLPSANI